MVVLVHQLVCEPVQGESKAGRKEKAWCDNEVWIAVSQGHRYHRVAVES